MPNSLLRLLKPMLSLAIASFVVIAALTEPTTAVPRVGFSKDLLDDAELSIGAMESNPSISDNLSGDAALQSQPLQYRSGGHVLGFTPERVYVAGMGYALVEEFVGANEVQPVSDESATQGSLGQQVPTLSQVTYPELWDGITLRYEGRNEGIAESFWDLSPGTEADAIQIRYSTEFSIQSDGSLRLDHPGGQGWFTLSAPVAWQVIDGDRKPVEVAFHQVDEKILGYRLGEYDPIHGVIIDPVLQWNTFHGSAGEDLCNSLAIDADGNIYVAGHSNATWGAPVNAHAGDFDFSVLKLDSNGVLQWNTFHGSSWNEFGYALAVDANGYVYVSGHSYGPWGSPVDPFQGSEAVITVFKLDNDGKLQWNTFHGPPYSSSYGEIFALALDVNSNVYVAGSSTHNWGTPVNAHSGGERDIVVLKLDGNGVLQWNTFYGSRENDYGRAIAVATTGDIYIAGSSDASWGSPLNAHAGGYYDIAVLKLNNNGALQWHTFHGSAGNDSGSAMAVDANGNIYVAGSSDASWGNPLNAHLGSYQAVIFKLNGTGVLQWNTFHDSWSSDAVATDIVGNVYVTTDDVDVLKLNGNGVEQWNTAHIPAAYTTDRALVVDDNKNVFVAGYSERTWGNPVNPYADNRDFFVARLSPGDYGDAPSSYSTLVEWNIWEYAKNGARHSSLGVTLGAQRDVEGNGQPTLNADGDDESGIDDEDGVSFSPMTVGLGASITVTASDAGKLDAWIDYNADGDWADIGEQVFTSLPLVPGNNVLNLSIPSNAIGDDTYARFRISSAGGLSYDGAALDGEVEDYRITIAKGDQSITFDALPDMTFGIPPFSISATADSGLPVSFTSDTTNICTVSGDAVTLISVGTCTIRAFQEGNASYNPAGDILQSFTVSKANQSITFDAFPDMTFGIPPFSISATADSGLPVSFTSDTTNICTVSGDAVTLISVGTCTIRAFQEGNASYNPAVDILQSFTVSKADQSINFGELPDKTFGDPPFDVSAVASSGLPVSFSSDTSSTCVVSGDTVSLIKSGTCTIRASQSGDANYNPASDALQSFTTRWLLSVTVVGGSSSVFINITGEVANACADKCSYTVLDSAQVLFTAIPDPQWQKYENSWGNACSHYGDSPFCSILMDSNLDVTAYFHCVNWLIPDTEVTESVDPWYCEEIVATEGFEISGDDTEVIFEAGTSIEMGVDFNVKEGAGFRAIISP